MFLSSDDQVMQKGQHLYEIHFYLFAYIVIISLQTTQWSGYKADVWHVIPGISQAY